MGFILITFERQYYTGGGEIWTVYGHVSPHNNEQIAEFNTFQETMLFVWGYRLPVMCGHRHEDILEILSRS